MISAKAYGAYEGMTLFPAEKTLKKWFHLVPTDGDLVFFKNRHQASVFLDLGVPLYTVHEAKAQSAEFLGLNQRSWYGYSLGKSAFCMKMPPGVIESLELSLQEKLLKIQSQIKVPSVVKSSLSKKLLKAGFPKNKTHLWITAQSWKRASQSEKLLVLEEYYRKNYRVEQYSKVSLNKLSAEAKSTLKKHRLEKIIHCFMDHSGPNCFALVAQAISPQHQNISDSWLHWSPLKRFLIQQGFKKIRSETPQSGDVLIFMDDKHALHGCFALDKHFVIEKPGQDFYEPYLLSSLKSCRKAWKNTQLHIWRKRS